MNNKIFWCRTQSASSHSVLRIRVSTGPGLTDRSPPPLKIQHFNEHRIKISLAAIDGGKQPNNFKPLRILMISECIKGSLYAASCLQGGPQTLSRE